VDPYAKPKELLEISPKSLVPALKLNSYDSPRAVNESTVIMDYVEE
jgi:glutathione S-transferase